MGKCTVINIDTARAAREVIGEVPEAVGRPSVVVTALRSAERIPGVCLGRDVVRGLGRRIAAALLDSPRP